MFSLFVFMENLLIICLILISIKDIKERTIPNTLVVAIYLIGILNLISGRVNYAESIMGLLIMPVIILLVSKLFKYKVGMGDIKLISAIGFALGFGSQIVVLAVGMGVCLMVLAITRKKAIFLGPFISFGAFIALIIGRFIVK